MDVVDCKCVLAHQSEWTEDPEPVLMLPLSRVAAQLCLAAQGSHTAADAALPELLTPASLAHPSHSILQWRACLPPSRGLAGCSCWARCECNASTHALLLRRS